MAAPPNSSLRYQRAHEPGCSKIVPANNAVGFFPAHDLPGKFSIFSIAKENVSQIFRATLSQRKLVSGDTLEDGGRGALLGYKTQSAWRPGSKDVHTCEGANRLGAPLFLWKTGRAFEAFFTAGTELQTSITSLAESSDQTVSANNRLSGHNRVICFHDGKAQQEFSSPQVPLLNQIDAAAGPGVWMSASGGGMTLYYDGRFSPDLLKQSAEFGPFLDVAVEPNGSVCGATQVGLVVRKENTLRVLSKKRPASGSVMTAPYK